MASHGIKTRYNMSAIVKKLFECLYSQRRKKKKSHVPCREEVGKGEI